MRDSMLQKNKHAAGNAVQFVLRALRYHLIGLKLKRAARNSPLRIAIGAGDECAAGWIATDKEHIDVVYPASMSRYFKKDAIDAILAEHVWEHLTDTDAWLAAQTCRYFLKPGGYMRIAVPDGFFPDSRYIEQVRPGGSGPGAEDHRVLYNYRTLQDLFGSLGYEVRLLEYWDEAGVFHAAPWEAKDGLIRRSKKYDPRNHEGGLGYTSLILDAIKR